MLGMSPNLAGTETFIYNYYKTFDKKKIRVDFIKRTEEKIIFEDKILENGSRIYYIPTKRENFKLYKQTMEKFFSNHASDYDAIWDNTMLLSNIDFLIYAKKYGIKDRIVHSHISSTKNKSIKRVLHEINKRRLPKIANRFFACSNVAADFLYSGKSRQDAYIINNAIDIDKYQFNESARKSLKEQYFIDEDTKIVGTIGRSSEQKNQLFFIDIAKELVKRKEKFKIVIVGNDPLSALDKELQKRIAEESLEDYFLLVGKQLDIPAWLSLFDIFVLPSLFEGLPFVAIEAQANGLPLLLSGGISSETKLMDNVEFLTLSSSIEEWGTIIQSLIGMDRCSKKDIYQRFSERGYILETNCSNIENLLVEPDSSCR